MRIKPPNLLRPGALNMHHTLLLFLFAVLFVFFGRASHAAEDWIVPDGGGQPQVQLYFFWSLTCPHCRAAHPYVDAIPQTRPWVQLHALELSQHPENVRVFEEMAQRTGTRAVSVPTFMFCGEAHVGWGSDETTGAFLRQRLDACHLLALADMPEPEVAVPAPEETAMVPLLNNGQGQETAAPAPEEPSILPPLNNISGQEAAASVSREPPIRLPLLGEVDASSLSLPVLTLVLAGLDAFNPCAFFVLLFLLSMMVHQKNRGRMLLIGGVFVLVSGVMYFTFMAAWLNVFQLFGHLAWVTAAAGALAVFVGIVNVKDFFLFERGISLSIPESKKPDIFRRARAILVAENLPAMLAATLFLAIAANFYELLCTAGFPMVYTRMLTLAELSPAARYGYLAAYNVIYVLPLALIVAVFARSLGARKLTEREGRLLKLMSGVMMLGLGGLLLLAPELINRVGVAFLLMALALGITWIAARKTKKQG